MHFKMKKITALFLCLLFSLNIFAHQLIGSGHTHIYINAKKYSDEDKYCIYHNNLVNFKIYEYDDAYLIVFHAGTLLQTLEDEKDRFERWAVNERLCGYHNMGCIDKTYINGSVWAPALFVQINKENTNYVKGD